MNNIDLRSILISLQDRLSTDDRKRLHFYLTNEVPRTISEDSSLGGTLSLIQSLIDQDKINDADCTLLIDAFNQIRCAKAVKLLKGYMKRIKGPPRSPTTVTTPLIDQLYIDLEDDKCPTTENVFTNELKRCVKQEISIDDVDINENSTTITLNEKKRLSIQSHKTQFFEIYSRTSKYLLSIFLFFVIALGILTIILVFGINQTNIEKDDLETKYNFTLKQQTKNNETIEYLNKLMLEKNESIKQLTNQIKELEEEKNTLFIKVGRKFGSKDGEYFDDSKRFDLNYSYYLNGIRSYIDDNDHKSYKFFYRSSCDNGIRKESDLHGSKMSKLGKDFYFDKDEKIKKVLVHISEKIISLNGTNVTLTFIDGVQFFSTKNIGSPSYNNILGQTYIESFEGYILGYVTGMSSSSMIHQLQFVWYRTDEEKHNNE